MSDGESVTRWIASIKDSTDEEAATQLWNRYHARLVKLAEQELRHVRVVDGEDVAADVLYTLIRGAGEGRFERLVGRDDLWCLLIAITKHKARDQNRRQSAQKRGGGMVRGESFFEAIDREAFRTGLAGLVGTDPTPEDLAVLREEHGRLLGLLDDELRRIAELRIEGHTVREIAVELHRTPGAVERKLARIRTKWAGELGG